MAKEDVRGWGLFETPSPRSPFYCLFRLPVSTLGFLLRPNSSSLPNRCAFTVCCALFFCLNHTLFARRALPFFSLAVIDTSIPQVIYLYTAVLLCLSPPPLTPPKAGLDSGTPVIFLISSSDYRFSPQKTTTKSACMSRDRPG